MFRTRTFITYFTYLLTILDFDLQNCIDEYDVPVGGPEVRADEVGGGHVTCDGGSRLRPTHRHDLSGSGDERGVGGWEVGGVQRSPGHVTEEDGLEDGGVDQQILVHVLRQGLEGRVIWGEDCDVLGVEDLGQLRGGERLGELGEASGAVDDVQDGAGVITGRTGWRRRRCWRRRLKTKFLLTV